MSRETPPRDQTTVLRIIARLNVGGPAIQAISLTKLLTGRGYRTTLLRGRESEREASMDYLAQRLEVEPTRIPGLRRELGLHDLRALFNVMRCIGRERPEILHTHTAKAGTIGRIAALLMPWARPRVVVHTFHGHVFRGEFSERISRLFARLERFLARRTTKLIAVSNEIRDDLVSFGVASQDQIEVVHLGFDLSLFVREERERAEVRRATRARLGIPDDAMVVSVIARVVKVKRIDRFIAMARRVAYRRDAWFLVVGDGDKRPELEQSPDARALGHRLVWTGFEQDVASICFASDVVALSSDNEGTPVCLIEAQAAGVPVVTTAVGGVESVVRDGRTGLIVEPDAEALADAVGELLSDERRRREWGREGQAHSLANFSIDRLVNDIDALYSRLLTEDVREAAKGKT